MEEKKNSNTGLIICLIIIILGLAGYICYDKLFDKKNPVKTEEKNNEKESNENEKLYDITTLAEYDIYPQTKYEEDHHNGVKAVVEDITINYQTDSVKKLNQEIKAKADDIINNIPNKSAEYAGCTCFKKDGKEICITHMKSLRYEAFDSQDYLLIKEIETNHTYCASGGSVASYYTISKDTKEVLDNDAVLKVFNYNKNDIEAKLRELTEKEYSDLEIDAKWTINRRIENLNCFIYDGILYLENIGPNYGNEYYTYDGKDLKKIEYDEFKDIPFLSVD